LIKKAEDTEVDTAEQSAIKLRSQQHPSNALVVTDQRPANGIPPVTQLSLVKVPSMSSNVVSACFLFFFSFLKKLFLVCFFP
jgi:AP-2 complex subunit alpha